MAEVQDRRLVRERARQPQPYEPSRRLDLVEHVLHTRITKVVEHLHAVNPQHHRQLIGSPAPACPGIERADAFLRAVPTGSDRPCAQGISPAGSCASCSRIPSRQMLAGPSCLHPKHLCFVYGILLCHNTPDLFRVSLGIQGVVVGTPAGQWTNVAVNHIIPTDFSFLSKTRLLLLDFKFWTASLAFSFTMTGVGFMASRYRRRDLLWAIPIVIVLGLLFFAPVVLLSEFSILLVPTTVVLTAIAASFAILTLPRSNTLRLLAEVTIGFFSVLTSAALLFWFGYSDDEPGSNTGITFAFVAVLAYLLAVTFLIMSRDKLRNWRLTTASIATVTTLS